MKITEELFSELSNAVLSTLKPIEPSAIRHGMSSERWRWDILWFSRFPIDKLYNAGLNDDHIDAALKAIIRKAQQRHWH